MILDGSTLSILPLLIVLSVFRRQLVSGTVSGAIKGGG
jgi:ABC-type glycerol-3-phosphate transport system permease component